MPAASAASAPTGVILAQRSPEADPAQTTLPISIRVVLPSAEPLVAGRLASDLKVTIRNTTPFAGRQGVAMPLQAIVLRGVHWAGHRDDVRPWLRRLPGMTREEADGVVTHNASAGGLTHLAFETGLLLPGESVTAPAPLTPQRGGRHELVVRYAAVGGSHDWMSEVLLPAELPRHEGAWYRPATPALVAARRGSSDLSESRGIVRSTSKPDGPGLRVQTRTFTVQLPLAADLRAEQTGGLSVEDAAKQAGLDALGEKYLAFYREALRSWFFVRADGSAVGLRQETDPRAAASPKAPPLFRWVARPLPKMDRTAPDEFARGADNTTAILLRPDVFGDLVKVNVPTEKRYRDEGATQVNPQELWAVLDRAHARNIELRLLTVDPNRLGAHWVLSAGVASE